MKQKLAFFSITISFLPFISIPALAGTLSGLDDFTPTSKVYANDMNQKMQDISTAVNDNNQKIDNHIGNTNIHHNRYTDNEAQMAMGAKGNANTLNHDRYSDTEAVNAMGPPNNINSLNHARYTNNEAVTAMGAVSNSNSLNHDRYTNTEAVSAMGAAGNGNSLNHDRYTNSEAVSAMGVVGNSNSLNHNRYTDAEAQAALASHTSDPYAHHSPPLMWASVDTTTTGGHVFSLSSGEINTVTINVPANGFLVIAGMSYVNNGSTTATEDLYLVPYIDGVDALPSDTFPGWATYFNAPPNAKQSMAYTITVPITSGQHIVSQEIFVEDGDGDTSWNKNHLTVTFFPQQQGTIVDQLGQPIP